MVFFNGISLLLRNSIYVLFSEFIRVRSKNKIPLKNHNFREFGLKKQNVSEYVENMKKIWFF